jgi:hypothetical protein
MEKKQYSNPLVEVVQIATSHLLDSSMNVLPPQPAPKRQETVF